MEREDVARAEVARCARRMVLADEEHLLGNRFELGHHAQHVLGTDLAVRQRMAEQPALERQLSTRAELQADCHAGVWARSTAQRSPLDPGDVEEAMRAAQAVGDDTLQRRAGRTVRPDTFTHGSSEQRARWFQQGYASGRIESCDTFAAPML